MLYLFSKIIKVYLALPITVEQGTDWKSLVFSGDSIRKTSIPLLKSKINILIRCLEILKQRRISFDYTVVLYCILSTLFI